MHDLLQRVHKADTGAFLWLHVTKQIPYRKSVRWLSRSGDGYLYVLIGLVIWWLEPALGPKFAAACVLAYMLEVVLYLVLKNLIKRNRPAIHIASYKPWITPSDQFSFPSGHTAAAFVFAGLMCEFYPAVAGLFLLWASLIGLSRVLLGVHYPSDIAAGALLGTSCAITAASVIL